MTASFYILMMLTLDYGWGIANINGNPFISKESCIETLTDIKRLYATKLHSKYYLNLKCVERKKNYLERKNDEPLYKNATAVDFF